MADALVKRAYDIQITGFEKAKEQLESLTATITALDNAKIKLDAKLKTKLELGDPKGIEDLKNQIKALDDQIKNLDKTRERSAKELEILARAEKLEADAKLASAKATNELIKGDALRNASIIAQERELDRLIAKEEKEEEARRKANAAAEASGRINTTGTNTTNTTNNTTSGLNVNANTGAANDSLKELRATLKALESEFANLSLSSTDYREKSKSLSDSIRSTKIEIAQLTESTKLSRAETLSLSTAIEVEANSYKDVRAQLAQLKPFIESNALTSTNTVDFRGQTLGITEAIAKFKELSSVEQDFRRQFAKDGLLVAEYSSGIIKAFKDLGVTDIFTKQKNDITNNLNEIRTQNQLLAEEYKKLATTSKQSLDQISNSLKQNNIEQTNLQTSLHSASGQQKIDMESQLAELRKVNAELKTQFDLLKKSGGEAFDKLTNDLKENIALQEKMQQSLSHIDDALGKSGTIGSTFAKSINDGFRSAKEGIQQLLIGYLGFQAAVSGVSNVIRVNFDFESSSKELKAITGVAGEQLEFLKKKALETSDTTRFSAVETLSAFKLIASAKPELLQDVEALNQIKDATVTLAQASGTDLPTAVSALTKTLNQFGEGAKESGKFVDALAAGAKFGAAEIPQITEALLDFGTQAKGANVSIFESTALIETLADKGIVGAEAGTKLRNVMLSLSAVEGLPKSALQSLQDFGVNTKILSDTTLPLEARLTELSKIAGNNAAILNVFGKENFNAAQIVLTSIPRYAQLKTQIQETGVAQAQAADQTNTAAAAFTRLKNQFNNLATSDNVTTVLRGVANALSNILGVITAIPFGIVLTGLSLITAAWAFYRGNVIASTLAQSANNEATLLGSIRLALMRSGLLGVAAQQQAYAIRAAAATVATSAQATATGAATVATQGLNTAVRASPLGIILSVLLLLIPALTAFGSKLSDNASKLREQNTELKNFAQFNNDIAASMNEQTAKTKNNIGELVNIIRTEKDNLNLRKRAYDELIRQAPEFTGTLDAEFRATDRLNLVYDKFIAQLDKVARAKAIRTVKDKIESDKVEKQTAEFNAKLDADAEAANNREIQRQNKATALEGLSSTSLGGAGSAFARIKKIQNDKAEAYEAARKEAEKAERKAKDFNKFISEKLTPEEKLALVSSATEIVGPTKQTTATRTAIGGNIEELKSQLTDVNREISQIDAIKVKSEEQIKKLKELRITKAEIIRQIREQNGSVSTKTTTTRQRADSLDVDDQNKFKDIDAKRDEETTAVKLKFAQRVINEKEYLNEVLKINTDAITKKLTILDGSNSEERRKIGQLHLERINDETETNKKLFELYSKDAENRVTQQTREAKRTLDTVTNDPTSTFTQRNKAQQDYNISVLTAQTAFNNEMNSLEIKYNQKSESNELKRAETIGSILRDIRLQRRAVADAELADLQRQGDDQVAKVKVVFETQRKAILESRRSVNDKGTALTELDKQENISILTREIETMSKELPVYQGKLADKSITEAQYADFYTSYVRKINDLNNALTSSTENITNVNELSTRSLSKLFGFAKGGDTEKLLGQTIAESFNLAKSAMQDYFDAEKQSIEQSKQAAYARIDLEKQQLLSHAQSEAEKRSIEKQAQQQRERADRDAFEKTKKMQVAQAQINLATQLSNLAVIAFSPNPLNILTLGAAGAVMYGIQAALALANYALNVSRINSAKAFASGGLVNNIKNIWSTNNSRTNNIKTFKKDDEDIPVIGAGRITIAPNIDRQPNGDNVLAHVPVGHVILNERQQNDIKRVSGSSSLSSRTSSATSRNQNTILATVKVGEVILDEEEQKKLGGPVVFKKIGVPGFADGGIAAPLGGSTMIGSTLVPPTNPAAFLSGSSGTNREVAELSKMIAVVADNVNSVNNRITNLKVINVVTETDRVLQDNKKANNIGTL